MKAKNIMIVILTQILLVALLFIQFHFIPFGSAQFSVLGKLDTYNKEWVEYVGYDYLEADYLAPAHAAPERVKSYFVFVPGESGSFEIDRTVERGRLFQKDGEVVLPGFVYGKDESGDRYHIGEFLPDLTVDDLGEKPDGEFLITFEVGPFGQFKIVNIE